MVIYLHGFGGSGDSIKAEALRNAGLTVVSPDLPFNPTEVEELIHALILTYIPEEYSKEKLVFVGTSLGGFYSGYFSAKYDCPAILINPAVNPSESFKSRVGVNVKVSNPSETIEVTEQDLEKFKAMSAYMDEEMNGCLIHLFTAKDDEVLDYRRVNEHYKYARTRVITEDGGHRFEKHMGMIVDKVKEIMEEE